MQTTPTPSTNTGDHNMNYHLAYSILQDLADYLYEQNQEDEIESDGPVGTTIYEIDGVLRRMRLHAWTDSDMWANHPVWKNRVLSLIARAAHTLWVNHQDELNHAHFGDSEQNGPDPDDCSYCRVMTQAAKLLTYPDAYKANLYTSFYKGMTKHEAEPEGH